MQLPVLPTPNRPLPTPTPEAGPVAPDVQGLSEALARTIRGQVRFGDHDRNLYATDASLYQVMPIGVVVPADRADLEVAVRTCFERGVPMLPRGGGTSLAGQCTSHAVVLDTSANLRDIREINAQEQTVYAEAGVAIDEINNELTRRKVKLFYAPDPATTAQATVGGTIGNNASGSRSVKYGRTVDSVLAIDAMLCSGHVARFEPGAGARDPVALKLADGVIQIVREHEALIRARYPKTLRRNAGYALDIILSQLDAGATAQTLNLAPLLCGSEGTLAITLGARLRLFPQPVAKGLALLSFASVDEAIQCVPAILTTAPSAVELVDDVVIEAAMNNFECRPFVEAFPKLEGGRSPAAVLYVEYHIGETSGGSAGATQELEAQFARLRPLVGNAPIRLVNDASGMGNAWKLRKAGEPLLHGLPGARKPLTFVEDNAVPVENLARFVREFRAIVEREGTRAAFWAHASVGVLHVRPMLDPRSLPDKEALLRIAVEAADLAKACGGVMSGEHGDGRVRGPLLERFYGPELVAAFGRVKALFDPKNLLNPGNITQPGPIPSMLEQTRIQPRAGVDVHAPNVRTYYDYTSDEGFDHAIERCNGAGVCRKQSGGVMCPSYRATMDERHSTRGRGNALRLAITGQLPGTSDEAARWQDHETKRTLDLCLSCKACKSECPSNVDIAKLKAEYTAQGYKVAGSVPLNKRLVGHVRMLNRVGAIAPRLANWVNGLAPMRALINRVMRMHPERSMPRFSRSLYRVWARGPGRAAGGAGVGGATSGKRPRVVLFADCFTTYNESRIGVAARAVLEGLGYEVTLPRVGCCGRSMISVGMLEQASASVDATFAQLREAVLDSDVLAVLFVEPSCLSAIKDDWLTLRCATELAMRERLAHKSMLVEDFIEKRWSEHPSRELADSILKRAGATGGPAVLLHTHCHQKALFGPESSVALLRRVLGSRLHVLPTGCCGMAGSFGYDRDKFELSMRIANLTGEGGVPGGGVMPFVRSEPDATILATGTSCRHQIHDASDHTRAAAHPIEFLASLMTDASPIVPR